MLGRFLPGSRRSIEALENQVFLNYASLNYARGISWDVLRTILIRCVDSSLAASLSSTALAIFPVAVVGIADKKMICVGRL